MTPAQFQVQIGEPVLLVCSFFVNCAKSRVPITQSDSLPKSRS